MNKLDDQKLVKSMGEARMIAASDNIIFPMIEQLIANRLAQACGRFAGGDTEFIADIAYIQGLKELANKLKQMQSAGNAATEKLNNN